MKGERLIWFQHVDHELSTAYWSSAEYSSGTMGTLCLASLLLGQKAATINPPVEFRLYTFFTPFQTNPYHFLQVRGYTSLRAVTPRGRTKGLASSTLVDVLLGSGWQLSEQAPWSASTPASALVLPQAPSAAPPTVAEAPLARCSASLCTSSWTPSTSRDSSSMLRCCSKSGRTTGRLRSTSKVSWPAGTLGSPCRKEKRKLHSAELADEIWWVNAGQNIENVPFKGSWLCRSDW